jgi:membrane protein required for colicin V production
MSWVDWAIGGILAIFVFNGLMQGFTRQITSLGGVIIGLVFAFLFTSEVASRLSTDTESGFPIGPLVFTFIFLGTWIGVNILGFAIRHGKRAQGTDQADEVAGALVGLVLGILVLAILAMGSVRLGVPLGQDIQASKTGGWLLMLGERLGTLVP